MQTRKIVVGVKTVDEGHCNGSCDYMSYGCNDHGEYWWCAIADEQLKYEKPIGYIRTKSCKDNEMKEEK